MEPRLLLRDRMLLVLAITGVLLAPSSVAAQPPLAPTTTTPVLDPIALALAPKPGGLRVEDVARTVARTKHSVRAKQEDLKIAASRVDQAMVNFFPRVSLSTTYTRLSPITYPPLFKPTLRNGAPFVIGGVVATTTSGQVLTGACPPPAPATSTCVVDSTMKAALSVPLVLPPPPLNTYALVASIAVPVSDYVFRLSHGYASATHNKKSAYLLAEAEALQAAADAKMAYFNWVRAKGGVVVADEAIDQVKAHLEDAKKVLAVGLASDADVLRVEAQMAAAQQSQAEAIAFASVAEEQLRTLLGIPADTMLEIGSDVMNQPVVPPAETLQALEEQAVVRRLEIRSLDETVYSLKAAESLTKASYAPRLDAFADLTYANPNPRIFPAANEWVGTWDLGLRLSWTINDTFTTLGAAAEAKARTAGVIEQKGTLRDALRIEVASSYADAIKALPTLEAADRGAISAEESLRVRRALFRIGRATSTELVDAEAELTGARLRRLDAHIGRLVAWARLEHATGRDVQVKPISE